MIMALLLFLSKVKKKYIFCINQCKSPKWLQSLADLKHVGNSLRRRVWISNKKNLKRKKSTFFVHSKACKANQLGCDVNENILISNGRTHYTPHYVQLYIKFANLYEYERINEIKMFKWVGSHLSWLHAQWIDKDGTNLAQDNTK